MFGNEARTLAEYEALIEEEERREQMAKAEDKADRLARPTTSAAAEFNKFSRTLGCSSAVPLHRAVGGSSRPQSASTVRSVGGMQIGVHQHQQRRTPLKITRPMVVHRQEKQRGADADEEEKDKAMRRGFLFFDNADVDSAAAQHEEEERRRRQRPRPEDEVNPQAWCADDPWMPFFVVNQDPSRPHPRTSRWVPRSTAAPHAEADDETRLPPEEIVWAHAKKRAEAAGSSAESAGGETQNTKGQQQPVADEFSGPEVNIGASSSGADPKEDPDVLWRHWRPATKRPASAFVERMSHTPDDRERIPEEAVSGHSREAAQREALRLTFNSAQPPAKSGLRFTGPDSFRTHNQKATVVSQDAEKITKMMRVRSFAMKNLFLGGDVEPERDPTKRAPSKAKAAAPTAGESRAAAKVKGAVAMSRKSGGGGDTSSHVVQCRELERRLKMRHSAAQRLWSSRPDETALRMPPHFANIT